MLGARPEGPGRAGRGAGAPRPQGAGGRGALPPRRPPASTSSWTGLDASGIRPWGGGGGLPNLVRAGAPLCFPGTLKCGLCRGQGACGPRPAGKCLLSGQELLFLAL